MKIVLSTRGSRGDVYPVIEIAAKMKMAGHEIFLAIPETFETIAKEKGLSPHLYAEDSNLIMKGMGRGMGSAKGALKFFAKSVDQQMEFMLEATKDADALIASVSELAAPTVGEYYGLPFYRLAYAPVLPGDQAPPLSPLQNMPKHVNRLVWKTFTLFSGYLIKKLINGRRKELGLKPATNPNRYFTGKSHTLLAINPTLAPPCPSWEKKYRFSYTGYCFGESTNELERGLEEFIRQGPPPVYIGFGSVHIKDPEHFTSLVSEAAARSGTRIVLSRGWTGLGKRTYSDHIFLTDDTDHAALFPKMAGVIHHGGSGTTHMGAKAGVPQFIIPQIIDQYYWAHRIYKLGLGPKPVSLKKITSKQLAGVFTEISNGKYRRNAVEMSKIMKDEDGAGEILKIVTRSRAVPIPVSELAG